MACCDIDVSRTLLRPRIGGQQCWLHTACRDLTPVEYERVYDGLHPAREPVGAAAGQVFVA
jgi:hypothetical protein